MGFAMLNPSYKSTTSLLQRAATAASNVVDVDDAGQRLDGGAGCGADLEASGDRDFDFARGEVEDDGDAAAAARLAGDDAFEAGEGAGLADEYLETGGGEGDDRHYLFERIELFRC